ncbi:pteridine-dependent deoxygenase [Luteibacter aegosomatissinici]|uniref:chorismate transformation enzyme, FkbO/Hyg5 family n=1 Tax=Luteibacter aegosomatissinici TaxID=2911539 RepID=UPI001FF99F2F|nr:pteridine-dependent deoxygenase [Luteibacter aegosomatissinici]UPG94799.1 pteridine-dependent deoxygenase [Luteibacter aegosomatissinici]
MRPASDMRERSPLAARPSPRVTYREPPTGSLPPGTLAAFGFGAQAVSPGDDPRWLRVALEPLAATPPELWTVEGEVSCGREGDLRWSRGGGWLYVAVECHEDRHGGPEEAATYAYKLLSAFVAQAPEQHVQRIWNYLGAINTGAGDDERYKQFCTGRIEGMGDVFAQGFPAASAIGHHADPGLLQVYLLATDRAGTRVENPRQVSAWQYPRQYGRTPPSFARATLLPAEDVLAISGTAAVVGHASAHAGDLGAQLAETRRNLDALLAQGGLPEGFDGNAPLKAYVRHPDDAAAVRAFANAHWPDAPLVLLHGDICREELLVEIDGWRYR